MILRLALWNLRGRRLRNVLTALSVTLAIGLLTFFLAARLHLARIESITKARHRVIVLPRYAGGAMSLGARAELTKLPGVVRVIDQLFVPGASADKRYTYPLMGVGDDYVTTAGEWFHVPPEMFARWQRERTGVILGRQTAEKLGLHEGQTAVLQSPRGQVPVVVSGISPRGYNPQNALVHFAYLDELLGRKGQVNFWMVDVAGAADVEPTARAIDDKFRSSPAPTRSMPEDLFLESRVSTLAVVPNLLASMGLLILFTTFLVTANTVAMSVRERIPEMATLRALGYRRAPILRLVVLETLILCMAGGVVGALAPHFLFRGGVELGAWTFGGVSVGLDAVAVALAAAALLAVGASLVPAWNASRVSVIESLRQAA